MSGLVYLEGRSAKSAIVEIDIEHYAEEVRYALEDPAFLAMLGNAVRDSWKMLAENSLSTSADAYLSALGEPEIDGKYVSVTLSGDGENGRLAMAIEEGADPFDMKEGLLDGRRSRVIRFLHKGPFAKNGTPIGQGYRPQLGAAAAAKIAKELKPHIAKLRGTGGRFKNSGGRLPAGLAPRLPGHATDLYANMRYRSVQATRGKGKAGGYGGGFSGFETFRTVTEESDGWHHPGLKARHFGEQAMEAVDRILDAAVDNVLDEVFR